jgi:hypothetical protein
MSHSFLHRTSHFAVQEPMSRNWLVADQRMENNTFPNGRPQYFYNPSSLNKWVIIPTDQAH